MPLRITLKPFERLFINGAVMCNGDRSATFLMETHCRFLRESQVIRESEADTPCKRLAVTVQAIYMTEPGHRQALEGHLLEQARAIMGAAPSTAPYVADILEHVAGDAHHKALKRAAALIAYEATLVSGFLSAA